MNLNSRRKFSCRIDEKLSEFDSTYYEICFSALISKTHVTLQPDAKAMHQNSREKMTQTHTKTFWIWQKTWLFLLRKCYKFLLYENVFQNNFRNSMKDFLSVLCSLPNEMRVTCLNSLVCNIATCETMGMTIEPQITCTPPLSCDNGTVIIFAFAVIWEAILRIFKQI
jgi:hypothetical protein